MILSKAGKSLLLVGLSCLLLMVFTGASYAQVVHLSTVHWTVTGNPTEVINTGRSEVSGSITLTVDDPGLVPTQGVPDPFVLTGNPLLGYSVLSITYGPNPNGPAIQIDNNTDTGVRVYAPQFSTSINLIVQNTTVLGPCAGTIQIQIPNGVPLRNGNVIKIEGVRLRVDLSSAANVNTDIWVQIQSVSDPAANAFLPDTVRVAKSFPAMTVGTASDTATLCLLNYGSKNGANALLTQYIRVTEGFFRAFVAQDSLANALPDATDRLDSNGGWLGGTGTTNNNPNTNGTQLKLYISGIPNSVTSAIWPATVFNNSGNPFSWFQIVPNTTTFVTGTLGGPANGYSSAVYEYFSNNQAQLSDFTLESFDFNPALQLSATNQQDTGIVLGGATMWPFVEAAGLCDVPHTAASSFYKTSGALGVFTATSGFGKPRFVTLYQSANGTSGVPDATTKQLPSNFGIYEVFAPCVCYLLYPYVTSTPFYDTGVAVANTSMDFQVFGAKGAPIQGGTVTWWLYDSLAKSLNTTGINLPSALQPGYAVDALGVPVYQAGQTFVGLVSQLLAQVTPAKATFSGYMIARANF